MSWIQCAGGPSDKDMIEGAKAHFRNKGEDAALAYLSECFSHDFKCPDKCDEKAMEFYEEYELEIEEEDDGHAIEAAERKIEIRQELEPAIGDGSL